MKKTFLYLVFNLISVHICHNCLHFSNYNVTFTARNFEYILHWSKYNLAQDVSFNVQYKRYGQTEWLLPHDCQNITRVYCNLTYAIAGDVEDFMDNQYFGRVRAVSSNCTSDWVISKRLNPREDTNLILPKLDYIPHVNSITIIVLTPYVPIRGRDKQPITVEDLYKNNNFEYHLNFFNSEKQDTWQKTQTDRLFEVTGLSPNMEYNGDVYISVNNERKSDRQPFVIKTLPDHSLVILITVLVAVFVIALGTGLFLLSYKYIKQGVHIPKSLVIQKSTTLPLMTLPKEKMINSCTVGFCPTIFMQNYEQKHQETSRKAWQEIPGDSKLQTYASQLHGAITPRKDPAVDTQESYCAQQNVSSVHYGGVFDRTTGNVTYLQNTTQNACSKVSHECEEDIHSDIHQSFGDFNGDVFNASIDNPFKLDLFSSLLSKESNNALISISPMGLIASVTVRDDGDFLSQMEQTEDPPVLLSDLHFDCSTNDQVEEDLQHNLLGHGSGSYILQRPVEKSTADTLDTEIAYKMQCIL